MADGTPAGTLSKVSTEQLQRLKAVSFFAGCGGLDLGLMGGFNFLGQHFPRTQFDVLAAYDIDPQCVQTYRENIGPHIEVANLARRDVRKMPSSDLLVGGFPCQEFSHCGPRKGLNSERGRLYMAMVRYAKAHKPKLVVGENVAGLKYLEDGRALSKIVKDFGAIGYRSTTWEVRADNFGVPQARHRIFLVFVREDLPLELLGEPQSNSRPVSVRDAIGDLLTRGRSTMPNQTQYFRAARATRGHGQGDERSPADGPGYTVRANSKSRVQFHYSRPRRLTVRECARLQSFPDTFVFPYTATDNMKLVGNAVPPVLAFAVAKSLQEFLLHPQVIVKK